jgi:N-acetylmuramoyl-L-alanine amidase
MWRTLGIVLIALGMLAAPAAADHGPVVSAACPLPSAQVVLDPGHGGPDPGAVNEEFGLHEADLTLVIANRVAEILRAGHGYSVALTRQDTGTELGNSQRGAIANACAAELFVEIHLNASVDASVDYAQAFWAVKEKDLVFSQVMNTALGTLGIPVNTVDRFDNGGLLFAKMPSVLVEAVFLSNPTEAEALRQTGRREEIAQAITAGIVAWFALWTG